MLLVASLLIVTLILLIGFFVITRDQKKNENKIFFLICIISALWALNFYFIDKHNSLRVVEITNGISYSLGALLMLFVVSFTYYFPKKRQNRNLFFFAGLYLTTAILGPTRLINGTVSGSTGKYSFEEGPLALVFSVVMLLGVAIILSNLFYKHKQFTAVEREQTKLLATGFALSFVSGVVVSTVLPIIYPASNIVDLAPFSVSFLIIYTLLAMYRHRLFDFRTVLIRAVSYLIIIGVVSIAYVAVLFIIRLVFLPSATITFGQLLSYIILGLFLIITYPRIKKTFDKITNSIFFRDSYDSQAMLDELNKVLVSDVEIDSLLKKVSSIVETNLKSEFCDFYLRDTSYFSRRVIGENIKEINETDINSIQKILPKIRKKIINSQDDPKDVAEAEITDILKRNNIVFMVRLVSTVEYEVSGIGFYVIGAKKSGNQYSAQDVKILEIIANELVIAIENALRFEETEQFNVTLQKKIDDATKELKQSNEKLKALDEAKDEFVSMASHQLRTPLTSIKGYISMVVEGDAGEINDTQKQMLGQALFSSQRMVYLISDLLNVSRLKTGKFIIEQKPVYLPDLVESEMQQLHEGAQAKNITLSYIKPKKFPTLNLDDMKIRQVVMNFTDNAIYYTPSGGKITVALKDKKDSVEFTVKDTGIGVPKEERHKLFVKFYRAENARKARPDGTGLGLFMAKKVIVAQGGSIIFDSKEGKGSTFGFSFPKHRLEVQQVSPEAE